MNPRVLRIVVKVAATWLFVFPLLSLDRPPLAQTAATKGQARVRQEQGVSKVPASSPDEELRRAAGEYKASLRGLLSLREENLRKAVARRDRFINLRAGGLVSNRELAEAEKEVLEARSAIEEVGNQLVAADMFLAESLADNETMVTASRPPTSPVERRVQKSSYIRLTGSPNWSLSGVATVESFFQSRFGRRLPVSTIGQSSLHNRWCWDHRNSVDVGLSPDSPEGQALMIFLRSAGIPFLAFRSAVSGSSTGPHIHIGFPSHRIPNCTPSL